MAGHVFISYSRGDRGYADRLAAHLRQAGLPVWYDHELHTAHRFASVVQREIAGCAAFLVVLTPAAAGATWINREISYADLLGKPILPLLLEPCPTPILVRDLDREDVTGGALPSPGFVVDLHQFVRPPPTSAPPLSFSAARQPVYRGRLSRTLAAEERAAVGSVAWSPDGRYLASGHGDNTAAIWDAADGTRLRALAGHADWVRSVAWSPDSRHLASAAEDGSVLVWDVIAGARLGAYAHRGPVSAVAWSPDGASLAVAGTDGTVSVWSPDDGTEAQAVKLRAEVNAVAWAPDGQRLLCGGDDHRARVWDLLDGSQSLEVDHGSLVMSVAWAPAAIGPTGGTFATGGWNGTARIWEVDTGARVQHLVGHEDAVTSVEYSPDGRLLATGSRDHDARIWDAVTGLPLGILAGHTDAVRAVSWSPDGLRLATASWDETVRVWTVFGR